MCPIEIGSTRNRISIPFKFPLVQRSRGGTSACSSTVHKSVTNLHKKVRSFTVGTFRVVKTARGRVKWWRVPIPCPVDPPARHVDELFGFSVIIGHHLWISESHDMRRNQSALHSTPKTLPSTNGSKCTTTITTNCQRPRGKRGQIYFTRQLRASASYWSKSKCVTRITPFDDRRVNSSSQSDQLNPLGNTFFFFFFKKLAAKINCMPLPRWRTQSLHIWGKYLMTDFSPFSFRWMKETLSVQRPSLDYFFFFLFAQRRGLLNARLNVIQVSAY